MSELAEITFEDVPVRSIDLIVSDLFGMTPHNEAAIAEFLQAGSDDVLSLKSMDARFGDIVLPDCLVRILRYGEKYDIEVIWDLDSPRFHLEKKTLKYIRTVSANISAKYSVAQSHGGLEPSSDLNTRFFTGVDDGPLSRLFVE